ncbi:MAG: sensor domain-containing diguanylate cyclase [Candidatus Omnitrophica bacterium]|nr:sensor domain-containing diguanylate cyclase [Candidatus Omnitrophota bacterium]
MKTKISRYGSLKKVVEEINQSLDLDNVAVNLTENAFSIIANNQGVCLLYLIDKSKQGLRLFKAGKEEEKLVVKQKEGDLFDLWVLRNNRPLLVEDIRKDFRFDPERMKGKELRPFVSLISSPFVSEQRFSGILRLDNINPHFYSQDDLRFLMRICDLGAVALENSELFKETQELAIRDGLTKLFTKQYFSDRLKEECLRGTSGGRLSFSLLILDIDHFKNYNDQYGHAIGDIVLKKISQKIDNYFKKYQPVIGRFGGEEFSVILPGVDKKKASRLANELRKIIEKEKIVLRRKETNVTVSIGVAEFPMDAKESDGLIMKSDKAMYQAKEKGRNRVCCS